VPKEDFIKLEFGVHLWIAWCYWRLIARLASNGRGRTLSCGCLTRPKHRATEDVGSLTTTDRSRRHADEQMTDRMDDGRKAPSSRSPGRAGSTKRPLISRFTAVLLFYQRRRLGAAPVFFLVSCWCMSSMHNSVPRGMITRTRSSGRRKWQHRMWRFGLTTSPMRDIIRKSFSAIARKNRRTCTVRDPFPGPVWCTQSIVLRIKGAVVKQSTVCTVSKLLYRCYNVDKHEPISIFLAEMLLR